METVHKSVLPKEAIEGLNLKKGSVVVDATLGGGGHSSKIIEIIGNDGILIAIDRDIAAINNFAEFPISNFQFPNKSEISIYKNKNIYLVNDNFSDIKRILESLNIEKVDAVLADFGLSSDQLDDKERGFSFNSEALLDMRMDKSQEMSAKEIVNDYDELRLIKILREFGEEKFTTKIVKKIIQAREIKKIETVDELVKIIGQAVPEKYKHQKIHFATRTFQAIRMEVNQELESIEKFIQDVIYRISAGGRLAVISFHSGEDRLVKNIFKEMAVNCECPIEFPVCRCSRRAKVKIITRKPIVATEIEVAENPRSRSAKLRIVEKI